MKGRIHRHLVIEELEPRLAPVVVPGNFVTVDGTAGDDVIIVRDNGNPDDGVFEIVVGGGPVVMLSGLDGLTVNGLGGNDMLLIDETAGPLPVFTGDASGSHTNASFAAGGLGPGNIGIHFDGGAGNDGIEMIFANPADVAYFSDTVGAGNSGVVNVSGALTLSFENLAPMYFSGAGGTLTIDATLTPLAALNIDDDINAPGPLAVPAVAGDGITAIWDPAAGGFETVQFTGFNGVTVLGGNGAQTIDLIGIDHDGVLTDIVLDTDNTTGTDTANDQIQVESLPSGVTATLMGGAGNDWFYLGDPGGSTLDPIQGQVVISGAGDEGGTDSARLYDTQDAAGDNVTVTSTTVTGLTGYAGPGADVTYGNMDWITVDCTSLAADIINIQSSPAGCAVQVNTGTGGVFDDVVNICSDGPANTGTLNDIDGEIQLWFSAGDSTLNVSDFGDATGDTYRLSYNGSTTFLEFNDGDAALDIAYETTGARALANFNLIGANALTANNTYNIDDMTGRVSNTISDGDATAPGVGNHGTFNIWCDLLQDGAAHTFNGFVGNDTFNLNFDNNMGIPFSAGTTFTLNSGDPASDPANRDVVNINTTLDLGAHRVLEFRYASTVSGDMDIVGLGTETDTLDLNQVETINYTGCINENDEITVFGTAGDDTLSVTPTGLHSADVTLNGGPAPGSLGPDLSFAALAEATGLTVNGGAPGFAALPGGDTLEYSGWGQVPVYGPGTGRITNIGVALDVLYADMEILSSTGGLLSPLLAADADPTPGNEVNNGVADSFLVELDPTGTFLQVSVNGSLVYNGPVASVMGLLIEGSSDDDTLTVDAGNGLVALPNYVGFMGEALGANSGPSGDLLILEGDPGVPILRETYLSGPSIGLNPDDGLVVFDPDGNAGAGGGGGYLTPAPWNGDEQVVRFFGLAPIIDVTPAAQLDIFATAADNGIDIVDGTGFGGFTTALVRDAGGQFESVEFANKTVVTVNGMNGRDDAVINNPNGADGLAVLDVYMNELTGGTIVPDDNQDEYFQVSATGAGVTLRLFGGGGDEHFGMGEWVGLLDNIGGPVELVGGETGETVGDQWVLVDRDSVLPDWITFTDTSITGAAAGPITYSGMEELFFDTANLADVTIDLLSTPAGMTSYIELTYDRYIGTVTAGNATADFGDGTGTMDDILGPMRLDFTHSGYGVLQLDDTSDATGKTVTVDDVGADVEIAGLSPIPIRYVDSPGPFGGGLDDLAIMTGTGSDTITVNVTTAQNSTTVDSGAGNDAVVIADIQGAPPLQHLLLSEAVLTPSSSEFIEIYNPMGTPVDLSNYYLSDDEDYCLLPGAYGAGPAPSIGEFDFIVQFPVGTTIPAYGVMVVAVDGAGFLNDFGMAADFEIAGTDPGTPDMIATDVGATPGLTNSGENAVLFHWDGASDLVQDVDMVILGTPSAANSIRDKTFLGVDGPDADALMTTYGRDSVIMPQQASDPGFGFSTKRIAREGIYETHGLGNGLTGDDETSEDISVTWDSVFTAPNPGTHNVAPPAPVSLMVNGGAGNDTMELPNGAGNIVHYTFANATDGLIDVPWGTGSANIDFAGLELIYDSLIAVDREFVFADTDDTIVLSDDMFPNDDVSRIQSTASSPTVVFTNPDPVGLLIVHGDNGGAGNDTITVDILDGLLRAQVIASADDGDDTVRVYPHPLAFIVADGGDGTDTFAYVGTAVPPPTAPNGIWQQTGFADVSANNFEAGGASLNKVAELAGGQVILYDTDAAIDVDATDVIVGLDPTGSVNRVTLIGNPTGMGMLINPIGAAPVGVCDYRGAIANPLSFIACMNRSGWLSTFGGMAGFDLNGLTLDGVVFTADIDGDGDTSDLTAVYVDGGLGTVYLYGGAAGDVVVDSGGATYVYSGAELAGDLSVAGALGTLYAYNWGGDAISGEVRVGGAATSILSYGNLRGDVTTGGNLGTANIYGDVTGATTIGGDSTIFYVTGLVDGAVNVAGSASYIYALGGTGAAGDLTVGNGLYYLNSGGASDGDVAVTGNTSYLYFFGRLTGNVTVTDGNLTSLHVQNLGGVAVDGATIQVVNGSLGTQYLYGAVQNALLLALNGTMGGITVYGNLTDSTIRAQRLSTVGVTGIIGSAGPQEINATDGASSFRVWDTTQSATVSALNNHVLFGNVDAWVGVI